ncbi:hypothetical protein FHT40_003298 [Mycolicibacterium sp. BK556]|uniref:hypothetical protein n=1 Tax=Mycobacteriaceae TaxID=1762 RepID=UPI00105FB472|nr:MULTISPECIES: hypothetical protein [Mycobacteriaceae]MBB3603637.1 hypothetical protein [Mycolicibacterium sp. BK556]MBB3633832.1 hypothetical protein [Mycolicibacterium sp. BK607]MBB3751414.1 hypothetical protein [Mycolicibacterium sp. BK634]TDO11943.1 hypothetical protein EV580_3667 [Mycobacterium sp. BK086]
MRKHLRTLLACVIATVALGTVTACSGGSNTTANSPTPTSSAAAVKDFPKSAHYIADMPMAGGGTMTIGVAVEGDKIAAYACDGSTDEAWFFGTQKDGALDITSKYQDTLKASFNGTAVEGQLTMNNVNYAFTAPSVALPSAMYTAAANGVRASWVVRPDNTITGVQFKTSNDSDTSDLVQANEQKFRDQVRQRRQARLLQPAPPLAFGTWTATVNGVPVTAIRVDGDTRLS